MEAGFAFLRPYQVVLVVGPQRSGTTFVANVIAAELRSRYVDEQDVKGDPSLRLQGLLRLPYPVVVQCPAWTRHCHRLGGPQTAVVLVRRPVDEIVASQERIGWTLRCEPDELARYGVSRGPIAEVKYRFWDGRQKALLGPNAFEVEYHTLKRHPMWVDQAQRRDFGAKQIRPGEGDLRPARALGPTGRRDESEGR